MWWINILQHLNVNIWFILILLYLVTNRVYWFTFKLFKCLNVILHFLSILEVTFHVSSPAHSHSPEPGSALFTWIIKTYWHGQTSGGFIGQNHNISYKSILLTTIQYRVENPRKEYDYCNSLFPDNVSFFGILFSSLKRPNVGLCVCILFIGL